MTDVSARPDDPATTSPGVAGRTLAVAVGAAFIAFLDLSVVNIAFPTIAETYPATATSTLTWIVSGYAIAFAALLTPAGRLADVLGRRRLLVLALAGFAVTSLLCGLAPGADWLIAGRVLQGATAAFMVPAALGLVLAVTPRAKIGAAIGAWSAAGGFAAVVGPAIGGALVESLGWRSVFLVNVPIALILIVPGLRLPRPRARTGTPRCPIRSASSPSRSVSAPWSPRSPRDRTGAGPPPAHSSRCSAAPRWWCSHWPAPGATLTPPWP
ncbi:MFS transporter [Nocardia asteroides]|uniref:MFS transporter n=1 Tax=Nocardia asteroides TaxID=1824 RepID=UPI003B3A046A